MPAVASRRRVVATAAPVRVPSVPVTPLTTLNAFTVDVEDYFHVTAFEGQIKRENWDGFQGRVLRNTRRILKLLDDRGIHGTFFVLGWAAKKYPKLVREICRSGHEIGSHSYWHRLIYNLTPEEFRRDIRQSKDILEDISGKAVTTFRAPTFSITRRSLWALDILADEGFRVDSSIFPTYHDRYGIPNAPQQVHRIATENSSILEFPATVAQLGPFKMPVSGGGYFRLYPINWTVRALKNVNERQNRPFVFYVHPWEIDPEQPAVNAGSLTSRMRHYVNLHSTEAKLGMLLDSFQFDTLSRAARAVQSPMFDLGAKPYQA